MHYYPQAHAVALIYEHRFLALIGLLGEFTDLSLRDLVEQNPHGAPVDLDWEGDWATIQEHGGYLLSPADRNSRSPSQARRFYEQQYFEPL